MEKLLLLRPHRIEHAPVGIDGHQMAVLRNKINQIGFGIGLFHAPQATRLPVDCPAALNTTQRFPRVMCCGEFSDFILAGSMI